MRLAFVVMVACSGSRATTSNPRPQDPESVFGPLEVGGDYATYTKLTDEPFLSLDHGNRWVDVYVNEVGRTAYDSSAAIPEGTIVVKTSMLDDNGRPGTRPGPIYVMQKRAPGYAPDERDWWFAIHWASPDDPKDGPIYWRGKSPRVDYCNACHGDYDRSLGGLIPSSVLKR